MYNLKNNPYKYNESSQEENSSQQDDHIAPAFIKSHVFDNKQLPLIRNGPSDLNDNDERNNDPEEEEVHLRPKMKIIDAKQGEMKHSEFKNNSKLIDNVSSLMSVKSHSISQANLNKKAVNAAYTFKLKSPNPAKKKHDPVSLFQQTASSWKKDKFLTSRTDLKQGRKLQLQKRNKQYV